MADKTKELIRNNVVTDPEDALRKENCKMENRRNMAVIKDKKEKGFSYKDIGMPKIGKRDVLVKVKCCAVCGSDLVHYKWEDKTYLDSFTKIWPYVVGHEFAGEVVEVGDAVTYVKVGDRVGSDSHVPCGHCRQCQTGNPHLCNNMTIYGSTRDGAFSEYVACPEQTLYKLPEGLTYEMGSMLEPAGVCMRSVLDTGVSAGNVVVIGCGAIGIFAICAARHIGAHRIWAVDINQQRLDAAKDLGADYIINSLETPNYSEIIKEATEDGADVVLECSGSAPGFNEGVKCLCRGGHFRVIGMNKHPMTLEAPFQTFNMTEGNFKGTWGRLMFRDMERVSRMMLDGAFPFDKIITHRFPMSKANEAHERFSKGEGIKMVLYPPED